METIQVAADEHQVTVLESDIDRDGGRIILVAGAPQTFGDDEERLLRTLRAAVNKGLPLPVHVGVSEGRVFAGQVGATFRRTYTILGDTAALAARLMARAGEDEIWVSASAFSRGGGSFAATELEPFQVKGKEDAVRAVVLGDLLSETERTGETADEELPFVDRERERAVLSASVAPVRMGFGTLVELIGEPGIGKSRLAEELRTHCADMELLTLRCEQYESSTPYHVFRSFFRSLLDVPLTDAGAENRAALGERLRKVDEELVPWVPLLGAPLDAEVESTPEVDDLDPSFRRARLHGVLGSLLGGLLDSPTLLVFEDVHWMDDASTELLRSPRHPAADAPLAHLHDSSAGRGRIPRRRRDAAFAGADAPARAASPGRREVADSGCRGRAESFRRRSWARSSTEAQAIRFSSESSRLRRRRARRGSSCRTPSRRSLPRGSTGSLLQTARSCAGRRFSVRRSPVR